jgi:hypothetical protein
MLPSNDLIGVGIYSTMFDNPVKRDDIVHMWHDVKEDARAMAVFNNTGVTDLQSFENLINSPVHIIMVGMYNGKLASLGWLDCIGDRSAYVHFIALKWAYGGVSESVCRAAISRMLNIKKNDGSYIFDCLIGMTPVRNKLAVQFVKRVGFVSVGIIPMGAYDRIKGCSIDALNTYCTRSTLNESI